ncbi:MAG: response regulator transcription factor, partial [Ktedonobacteraceae bacterium]
EQVQAMRALTGIAAQRKRRTTLAERHSAQGLTPKEMQVLSLLVAGKTNKEIAEHLSITVGTVELHITHILTKLRCETHTQAVAKAISEGLVTV